MSVEFFQEQVELYPGGDAPAGYDLFYYKDKGTKSQSVLYMLDLKG